MIKFNIKSLRKEVRDKIKIILKELKMKKIEEKDVEKVALELIAKNSKTTTLEIKEKLRSNGFWATQSEVALMMDNIEQKSKLNSSANGTYRTFTSVPIGYPGVKVKGSTGHSGATGHTTFGGMKPLGGTQPKVTAKVINRVSGSTLNTPSTKKTRGKFKWSDAKQKTLGAHTTGDWKVIYSTTGTFKYYEGDVPRYTVRRHFSKTLKVPYIKVTAARVK